MKAKMKDVEFEEENTGEEMPAASTPEKPSQHVVVRINVKLFVLFVVLLVVAAGLFFAKSFFIAALINGVPITRFAVIGELEKQYGKQTLESLVVKKLINDELDKKSITVSDGDVQAQIAKIEAQIAQQGGTLQQVLEQQGISREELNEQVGTQKRIETLLGDKAVVSDEEAAKYIKDNSITAPEGKSQEELTNEVKEQLRAQKLGSEVNAWIESLKTSSTIRYLKTY